MHDKLVEILEEKKTEIKRLKRADHSDKATHFEGARRDFKSALATRERIDLIAEIKFGSPSAGTIRAQSDPMAIGKAYEASGAAAISLLTDRVFFKGDLHNLPMLKQAVNLPILRKDFILDEVQIVESAAFGADAVLLIARILSPSQLKDLLDAAGEYKMAVLTEVHDEMDLEKALKCDAEIIGINNRDLDTFRIDPNTTLKLMPHIPETRVRVSESGIRSGRDLSALKGLNLDAVLVGSALMAVNDPGEMAAEMVKAGA
jgi:indole-3-glycerol phosphate synthase